MTPLDSLRKLGFRRWYERQLVESHAWLVTGFLCLIVAVASIEGLRDAGAAGGGRLALAVAAAIVCGLAVRRFLRQLFRAERIAEHAVCPGCEVQGKFEVVSAGGAAVEPNLGVEPPEPWLRVRCRKCSHEWLIE